jgi:AraC-like DNA-binding protein
MSCDQLVMGCIDARRPRPDEILVARHMRDADLLAWCDGGVKQDKLFATARRRETAVDTVGKASPHRGRGDVLCSLVSESPAGKRWWWLSMLRTKGGFSDADRAAAPLLLRQLQARFNHAGHPAVGRLLIGNDWRLIHADPHIAAWMAKREGMYEQLTGLLRVIAKQRWPDMAVGDCHDAQVHVGGDAWWLCFSLVAAVRDERAAHWSVELRPLEEALPAVGAIDDDRIAVALAYVHDHFHESPSLAAVADSAGISPFHFHRLFTKHIGISPKQYLQHKQLQVARWLLRATRTPVGRIADVTGFASHGHFTTTFHRVTGVSPTDYREQG